MTLLHLHVNLNDDYDDDDDDIQMWVNTYLDFQIKICSVLFFIQEEEELILATRVPTMLNARPATAGVEASAILTVCVMPLEATWKIAQPAN